MNKIYIDTSKSNKKSGVIDIIEHKNLISEMLNNLPFRKFACDY